MLKILRRVVGKIHSLSYLAAAASAGALALSSSAAWAQDKSGTRAGLVKLPAAGATVTAEGSTFVVQGNTGAANYTVPLPELPTRAGVAPALKLTYNQMSGDPASGFGSGWRVDVPAIEVNSERGIPYLVAFSDPDAGPGNDNQFRLQGQRLLPDPSQWGNGIWQYRLQTSDQEIKVRYHATPYAVKWGKAVDGVVPSIPSGFEVIYPDGKVELYTGDPNVAEGTDVLITKFPLVYEVYRQGEAIAYRYVKSANKAYLHEVAFASGLSRYTFDLMRATANVYSYRNGFLQTNGQLVQQLLATYNGKLRNRWCFVYEGPTAGPGNVVTAPACGAVAAPERALLTNDAPTHDRLVSVLRYGNTVTPDPTSAHDPRLHFEYSSWNAQDLASRNLVYPVAALQMPQLDATSFELVDVDRDGLPDILQTVSVTEPAQLYFGNANLGNMFSKGTQLLLSRDGFQVPPTLGTDDFQVADINGDSFADLIQVVPGTMYFFDGGNEHKELYQWKQASTTPDNYPFDQDTFAHGAAQFVDVNQDGLSDVLTTTFDGAGHLQWAVYLNMTSVDADGRWSVSFAERDFTLPMGFQAGFLTDTHAFKLVDVNGDGLPDFTWTNLSAQTMCVYENTGAFYQNTDSSTLLFGRPELNDGACGHGVGAKLAIPQFAQNLETWILDVNGDGIKDFVSMGPTSDEVDVSYGLGDLHFTNPKPLRLNAGITPGDVTRSRVADLDGDGQEEIVIFQPLTSGPSNAVILDFNRTPTTQLIKSGLMTSAETEGGDRHDIRYSTSTDEVARDKNLNLTPNALHFPAIVAKEVVRSTGRVGDHAWTDVDVTEYFYHDPYYDSANREFRGFREVDQLVYGDEYLAAPTQESSYIEETFATYDPAPLQRQLSGRPLTRRVSAVKTAPILKKLSDSNTFDPSDPLLHSLSTSTQAQQLVQSSHLLEETANTWQLVEQVPSSGTYFAQMTGSLTKVYGTSASSLKTTQKTTAYDQYNVVKSDRETSTWSDSPFGVAMPSVDKITTYNFDQARIDLAQFLAVSLPSKQVVTVNGITTGDVRTEYDPAKGLPTKTHSLVFQSAPPAALLQRVAGEDATLLGKLQALAGASREELTSLGYDDFGNVTSRTDGIGLAETAIYDASGVLPVLYHRVNLEDASSDQVTQMFYEGGDGRLSKYINPLQLAGSFSYDDLGRRKLVQFSDGGEEKYDYKLAVDNLPNLILTTSRRYAAGSTIPMGETETVSRLAAYRVDGVELGQVENAEEGGVRVLSYHRYNRKKNRTFSWTPYISTTLNGMANLTVEALFTAGQIPSPADATQPDQVGIESRYDPLDRVSWRHFPSGKELTMQYQPWGEVTTETYDVPNAPRATRTTTEVVSALGMLAKVEAGDTGQVVTRFSRDAAGHLTRIALDGEASPRELAFDSSGKQVDQKIPGAGEIYTLLDVRGRPNARIYVSSDGLTTALSEVAYDSLDRPTTRWDDGRLALEQTYDSYRTPFTPSGESTAHVAKPYGFLTSTRTYDANHIYDYEEQVGYNTRGNPLSRVVQLGQRTFAEEFGYTLDGAPVTLVTPRGLRADMSLNRANRLDKVTVSGAGIAAPTAVLEQVTYNAKNQIANVTYRKGANTAITYDPKTLLITQINSQYVDAEGLAQPLQKLTYDIDGDDKILAVHDGIKQSPFGAVDRSASFTYDWRGELTQAKRYQRTLGYTYTKTGAFLTNDELPGHWQVGTDTSLLPRGTDTGVFTYDTFGRLATSPEIAETRYDEAGRLLYARTRAGKEISYGYGPTGTRYYKHVVAADGTATDSLYPANSYVEEPSGAQSFLFVGSKRLVRFDHGHGAQPDQWFYYLEDQVGSNDILMTADGLPVEQNLYFGYGSEASATTLSTQWGAYLTAHAADLPREKTHHRYTGHYLDDETGLYYFGARYYHPQLGRFVTPDPLFIAEPTKCEKSILECNLFGYANNNPITFLDPNGTDVVFLLQRDGAFYQGHMALLLQDKTGAWYYMSQGPDGWFTPHTKGKVTFMPLTVKSDDGTTRSATKSEALAMAYSGKLEGKKFDDSYSLRTTTAQDDQIHKNAADLEREHANGGKSYDVLTNNCTQTAQAAVKNGTGIPLPSTIDPRPNNYMDVLRSAAPVSPGTPVSPAPAAGVTPPSPAKPPPQAP